VNILYINTLDERGGAATVAKTLMVTAIEKGHGASMFVGKKQGDSPFVFNIQKRYFLSTFLKQITGRDIERFIREKIERIFPNDIAFFNTRNLFSSDEYKKADIIHLHNLSGGYFNIADLGRICREKKVVWTLHDMWAITPSCPHTKNSVITNGFYECDTRIKNITYQKSKKVAAYLNDFNIVVPSLWLWNKIQGTILQTKPIHIIHNGVDTSVFKPLSKKSAREKLGLPKDKKIIAYLSHAGKMNPYKGYDYLERLMTALKDKSDIHFLTVGGSLKFHTERQTEVSYISERADLADIYSASDMFLFPSVAENFPLATLEAMACGLPIIAYDVGGVREQIEHLVNGYVAKEANFEDLYQGINYMLDLAPEKIEIMRAKNCSKVREMFDSEQMFNEYLVLYNSLCGQK
jgi:glycosyltransferase involved in cell wall biosynthesis